MTPIPTFPAKNRTFCVGTFAFWGHETSLLTTRRSFLGADALSTPMPCRRCLVDADALRPLVPVADADPDAATLVDDFFPRKIGLFASELLRPNSRNLDSHAARKMTKFGFFLMPMLRRRRLMAPTLDGADAMPTLLSTPMLDEELLT